MKLEKVIFNNEECYIAYKGLVYDLSNFRGNYTYELNKEYSCLDVDNNDPCSYGLHLAYTPSDAMMFGYIIFKCYVPINDNIIIKWDEKITCKRFYLSDEQIKYKANWDELADNQKDIMCENPNFDYEKYWNKSNSLQKESACRNLNFNYDKYWGELTEFQKDLVCEYNPNFKCEKYWNKLTKRQKNLVCQYSTNFNYEKYWNELNLHNKYIIKSKIVIKKDIKGIC